MSGGDGIEEWAAFIIIATGYTGRETLRRRGTYTVIKLAHAVEKDEKVRMASRRAECDNAKAAALFPYDPQISEHMIRLVGLLKRDEGPESERDHLQPQQFGQQLVIPEESGADRDRHDEEEDGNSDLEIEVI